MKPEHWDRWSKEQKRHYAHTLFNSQRGALIVGQALALASQHLREVEPPYLREESNAQDMEVLGETLFSLGWDLTISERAPEGG